MSKTTTTIALVALAAGGFWYAKSRSRAPATAAVPYNYAQVSCAEYRGHRLCVFRYPEPYADGSGSFEAYDFNVDGGTPRGGGGGSSYFQLRPEEAAEDARTFIDAMLGEATAPTEGAQEPAREPGAP